MKSNRSDRKNSIENALFVALKNNGLLYPVDEDAVDKFEMEVGDTQAQIPSELDTPEKFKPRQGKVIKFVPESNTKKKSLRLKKAASKITFKRRKK